MCEDFSNQEFPFSYGSCTHTFSGFLFATAKVAYLTAMIILHLIRHSPVHITWFSYIQNFIKKKHSRTLLLVLISNNYWTRLSKFVICLWRADQLFAEAEARLRQIIDLRDTDKSGYFAITEFNNCFIIRSPSFFFKMNILGKRSDRPFSRESDSKKEKSTVSITHVQNIICRQKLDGIAHEQTIICRQLFAVHVVGSRPMKRKKNLLRMIIRIMIHW